MDRNPAVTLSTVQSQWSNLEDTEVEAALFTELSLYYAAVDLLGTKPFCSFEDRVSNISRPTGPIRNTQGEPCNHAPRTDGSIQPPASHLRCGGARPW